MSFEVAKGFNIKEFAKNNLDKFQFKIWERKNEFQKIEMIMEKTNYFTLEFQYYINKEDFKEETFLSLLKMNNHNIINILCRREELPETVVRYILDNYEDNTGYISNVVLGNNLSQEVIKELSQHPVHFVRVLLSNRKDLPEDTIAELYKDEEEDVVSTISENYPKPTSDKLLNSFFNFFPK